MSHEVPTMKQAIPMSASGTAFALAAQPSRTTRTAAEAEPLLAKIAVYEYGADPAPSIRLEELVADLQTSPTERKALETRLLEFLRSHATAAGKQSAFRALARIGSDASIPTLAPMLERPETAEM